MVNAWIEYVVLLWSAKKSKIQKIHKINQHISQRSQKIDVSVRRVKENQTHRGRPPRGAEDGFGPKLELSRSL